MPKLLYFEFRRIIKSVFFWIVAAYSVVWPILTAVFYRVILTLEFTDTGVTLNKLHLSQGEVKFFTWFIAIAFMTELPKFVALFTCLHLGRDYSDGIVRNKIIAGHSRASIYFSYLITQICASTFFCVVYIASAMLGVAIAGIGVDVNGGEMFGRFATGIAVFLVMTVTFSVLAVIFRKRALPIILSILIAMMSNAAATVIGMYNTPSKAYDDYISLRNEKLEAMAEEGFLSDAFVKKVEKDYGKDKLTGIPWKIFHPVYVVSPMGFEVDYGASGFTSLMSGGSEYITTIDYSFSIFYSDESQDLIWQNVNMSKVGELENAGDIIFTPDSLEKVDSMHSDFNKLNGIYIGKSIIWAAVIGGWGYFVFQRKNMF